MSTAKNAKLDYESGQNATPMSALTNSGDNRIFTSNATLWSQRAGFAPDVRPDGIITGGEVTAAVSGNNDAVDVSAMTAYIQGNRITTNAELNLTITRPATNVSKICSIVCNAAGTISSIAGTDGDTTAFSEIRGAAGGPPYIPVDAIELRQIRVTSSTPAPIQASEVFGTVGIHMERYDYPTFEIEHYGGRVVMGAPLPTIHTGDVTKNIFASYAEPIFQEVPKASDYVPSANSHSVNSTQVYNGTVGSVSETLNQGTFVARLNDGITDPLAKLKDLILWFRFYPDRNRTPYILDQGTMGMVLNYPAGDSIQGNFTISAETASIGVDA